MIGDAVKVPRWRIPAGREAEFLAAITSDGIKTGDTVRHRPTDEKWLVAYSRDGYVCACGWPETLALASDCVVVDRSTARRAFNLLVEMAGSNRPGSRCRYATDILGSMPWLMEAE